MCTGDTCSPERGCVHTPVDAACEDYDPCTDNVCDVARGCLFPYNSAPCDDGDPCTMEDACTQGVCQGVPLDRDGDGHVAVACGGDDCDDEDPKVHPEAEEVCNEKDDDCDGLTDLVGRDLCDYDAICQRGKMVTCPEQAGPTNAPPIIDADAVWCARGSPFLLERSIAVLNGSQLTVGPCLEVLAGRDVVIDARGDFEVRAVPSNPAVFRSGASDPGREAWGGIRLGNYGIHYYSVRGAIIMNALVGMYLLEFSQGGGFRVTDTQFITNTQGMISGSIDNPREFSRLEFLDNGCGVLGGRFVMHDSVFRGNGFGICDSEGFQLYDSVFLENGAGIQSYFSEVRGCLFQDNRDAVLPGSGLESTPNLASCILVNNGSGITVGRLGMHYVVDSILCNNGLYDIRNLSRNVVDATRNWWCTTDPEEISARIHDIRDDAVLGEVRFEPFLTEAP
jgi:hypothetical protein